MSFVLIILGIISAAYDITLIVLNPGTFWDIVFSFTHIWAALGAYLVFVGIYRIKTRHSFWSIWNKKLKIAAASVFGVCAAVAFINLAFILNPEVVSVDEKADYVILLGGGIDKNGNLPFSVMTRVKKAAAYLKKNEGSICVVTGGTLKWLPYPEAPAIKQKLVESGIQPERILVEDQAKDTIQNFILSCRLLAEYEDVSNEEILNSSVAVVTSRFHLRRAERLARRLGFTHVKGIPAACPAIYIPHSYMREICAYVKLNLRILLTGKPSAADLLQE